MRIRIILALAAVLLIRAFTQTDENAVPESAPAAITTNLAAVSG